ncbi:MAG: methyltransferase, partial [Nanoarchaeota archaeon]|nr:methyltransferase [Nanoarchaeota archaeon]
MYEPQEDSYLILSQVRKFVKKGDAVLEIGTGSGLLAEEAAKRVKNVLAVDINKDAVAYCKKRIKNKKITFRTSDLFSSVKGKFDLIIFNPPYLPRDEGEPEDMSVALAGGKHGYEVLGNFLSEAADHLTPKGRILILFSDRTNKAKVEAFIKDALLDFKEVASKNIFFEILHVYLLKKNKFRSVLENKKITKIRKLARGHRGLVYTGILNSKKVSVKVQRKDIDARGTVDNEVRVLKIINKKRIGPELIMYGKDYFVYEFVEGEPIVPVLGRSTKKDIIKIIK